MSTGVSEVLMVRPSQMHGDVDVLEGLSSNVFVVYDSNGARWRSEWIRTTLGSRVRRNVWTEAGPATYTAT
jgi:hypothetical protein